MRRSVAQRDGISGRIHTPQQYWCRIYITIVVGLPRGSRELSVVNEIVKPVPKV
ncbi:MAG TPA: hypothetical protein VK215_10880 [Acidimicrobiales bacterium]|nr:hypothetical protein [Acidimicrobiales bacterium]